MTVHVHKDISGISAGGSTISKEGNGIADLETHRTWAFDAPPSAENRVLEDVELTSRSAGTVPKSVDEQTEEAAAQRHSAKDVADMATALKDLVNERRDANAAS